MKTSTEDLRSFLDDVDSRVKLLRVSKPVNVQDEIPALCSEITVPTVFESLAGHDSWRLTDCLVRDRVHQAVALKCSADEVITHYGNLTARGPGEIELVEDTPLNEVTLSGDDVDLDTIPVPIPSEGIDVPHLGIKQADYATPVISGSIAITRHPETGVHNCFFTMAKVIGKNRIHNYVFSPHTWENIRAWEARGEKAPIALVIGCHPVYELAAAYTGPHPGFSEIQLAAGMLGEKVALTQCKSIDLQVPAFAEVVIEGSVDSNTAQYLTTAGHTDTYSPFYSQEPFIDVSALRMRSDPIYRHIQPTRFTDHHSICEFITAPMLLNVLRGKGLPVKDVLVPLHSVLNCAVIQMTPGAREEVREALLNSMTLPFFPRITIAVDEDINIHSNDDIMYALSMRVDPEKDIMTVDGIRSFNLEPISKPIKGMEDSILRSSSRLGIDATRPPLSQPEERVHFERLRARGEGKVKLKDFVDS